jgi:F-type H+-transporting ATPase subunit c
MKINKWNVVSMVVVFAALPALAQTGTAAGVDTTHFSFDAQHFGTAIGVGLAAFGGAIGQGKVAAAALDGIARNPGAQPKMFLTTILGLVFIESLVIYSLVIALIK